jgi:hypothetical protein
METELRFGRFQGGRFIPGVSQKQFSDLIQYFTALGWKKSHTVDKVVSRTLNRTKTVRKIGNKYQLKEKLSIRDVPNQGYRRANSKETNLNNSKIFDNANRKSEYAVTRDRTTFKQENKQLDLTYLPETGKFQVELEYTGTQKIAYAVNRIKSILQGAELYKYLLGSYKFAGPLPGTLTKEAFDRKILTKKNYSVTDKADGERYLLYINVYGMFSFVTRKLEFNHIPIETPRPDYADTILDGEFINGTFYAFDALFAKGKDVREQPLTKRLDTVYDILMGLKLNFLRMKTFLVEKGGKVYQYPGNTPTNSTSIYDAAGAIWGNRKRLQYKLDGLIFTPVDEPYFNRDILKWKDDNTIDFYYEPSGSRTKLFLAGTGANGKYGVLPFDKAPGNLIFKDQGVSEDVRKGLIDKISEPPKGVAEFRFNGTTFKMIKFRPDKEFPNGVAASNQAWEAARNPLTIEELGQGPLDVKTNLANNLGNKKVDVIRLENIENYFESKEKFEKFLTYLYKHIKPGGRFIGTAKSLTTNKKLKFLGQKVVNFDKFNQVMTKWGFKLVSPNSNSKSFIFQKV